MLKLMSPLRNSCDGGSPLSANSQGPHTGRPAAAASLGRDAHERSKRQGGKTVNGFRKTVAAAAIAGSMLVGGVAGAVLYSATVLTASAATPSPSPSSSSSSTATFVPNEDPTHEAGESAAREAQENAGQVPTVP